MRITRLELHGFKSFPDRTTFQFGPGISCVVGPNGSGKSNVVDALKWCVGEQSARSLRGTEMVDVIFAGSTDRKPVGFAEVVLTLQATDGHPFPGEYAQIHELSVGRRLHRTGASEYFVNQARVRRRDVVELLMDSGIGNNLYSFIEQGQVDKMITATPQERRSLVDEAAGISRYKVRRDESQVRMVETATQLDRAADVLEEMTRQLRTLEQQVLRAARFRRVRALIRQRELTLALAKHHALTQDRRALRSRLDDARQRQDAARREVQRREEDLAERREELQVAEAAATTRRDEVAELDARIREQEATGTLHERRAAELRGEIERLHLEVQRSRMVVVEAEGERVAADTLADKLGAEQVAAEAAAVVATDTWRVERGRVEEARRASTAAETRAAEARTTVGVAEARVGAAEGTARDRRTARDAIAAQRLERERRALTSGKALDTMAARIGGEKALLAERGAAVEHAAAQLAASRTVEARAVEAARRAEDARDAALLVTRAAEAERARVADRGREWSRAVDERGARALRELDLEAARRRRAAAEDGQRAVSAALRELDEALGRAAATRQAEAEEAVARAVTAVTAAEVALADATAVSRSVDVEGAAARAAVGAGEAERDTLRRALAAVDGDRAALTEVLGEPRSLLQTVPDDRRADVLRVLQDRASWVVVRDAGTLRRLRERVRGTLSVWFWPAGTPDPAERTTWTDDPSPGAAPQAGPGFLAEANGAVHFLGASRLSAQAARLAVVEADLATATARRTAADGERDRARLVVKAATDQVTAAREAERTARSALRLTSDRAAQERAAARRASEESLRTEQAAASAKLDAVLSAERKTAERALADERREAEATLRAASAASVGPDAPVPDPEPARRELAAARAGVAAAQVVVDTERASESAQERKLAAAETERAALAATRDQDHAEIDALTRALADADVRIRDADAAIAAARGEVDAAQIGLAGTAAVVDLARTASLEADEAAAAAADRRTVAESARVGAKERASAAVERSAGAVRRREAAEAAVTRADADVARTRDALSTTRSAETEARTLAATAREARAGAWDAHERTRSHAAKLQLAMAAAEKAARAERARVEHLDREVGEGTASLAQSQQDLEILRRSMEDRYQVSLSAALDRAATTGFPLTVEPEAAAGVDLAGEVVEPVEPKTVTARDLIDEDALRASVDELEGLRAELGSLGEVNLAAHAEHRDLATRVGELASQRDDLAHALEQIRQAIARLNRECRERFRDTFDRVNEFFQVTYPKLVGGGSARLSLTDDEDLLETGVDIFVQPPGKRLQNLTLLSGGEKAMTAIALLIALFRVKPSPFCVLDEVDAPLDEANGARFNDMLRDMSQRSQFLVVTHNRKTMECADTLYGVTMARPGVSRLVSVNLGAW